MIRGIETIFRFIGCWCDRIERAVLGVLVASMVGISAVQILLRNIWHTGLDWADPLLGMSLLWLTMLGALAATGLGRHISINFADAALPRWATAPLARIMSGVAALVCGYLALAAGTYVGFQRELDTSLLLGWPVWKFQLIIPVSFWLMVMRFAVRVVVPVAWLDSPPVPAPAAPAESDSEKRGAK